MEFIVTRTPWRDFQPGVGAVFGQSGWLRVAGVARCVRTNHAPHPHEVPRGP